MNFLTFNNYSFPLPTNLSQVEEPSKGNRRQTCDEVSGLWNHYAIPD
jgi:hypothetical protein